MRASELDDVERAAHPDYLQPEDRVNRLQRKLTTLIEQSQGATKDYYSKGFIDGLKYALSLITQ